MEVQNQDLQRCSWALCPSFSPLSLYFSPLERRAAFWVLQLWWVYFYDLFVSKEVYSFNFYRVFIFQVPFSSGKHEGVKAHASRWDSFLQLFCLPLLYPALSIESRAKLASWLVFMDVTMSVCGDLLNTVCHETCLSAWISWWESLRNHWTTM